MLFVTLPFALFFLLLWAVLRRLPSRFEAAVLLLSSLLFYGLWYPALLPLLIGLAAINHQLLRGIIQGRHRQLALVTSIVATLGVLGWFKYADFVVTALRPLLRTQFGVSPPLPDVLLPLGISFYSFQMISVAVDAYRGDLEQAPPFKRYLLFVSFFPQLIAGPIVRGSQLLPQLALGGRTSPARTRRGLWLIALGLFKKAVMGDFLIAPFVNATFEEPGLGAAGAHLLVMYGFAFQIYFDFSGYTDMARGLARLLGYELPENFREPYLSLGPSELWRRWHITLSTWFRDYLYIPIGGSRGGAVRTAFNLLVVFALSGLWHGAAWTFVVWGLYHGLWLGLHRVMTPLLSRVTSAIEPSRRWRAAWTFLRWAVTFHLTALGFVVFRAPHIGAADAFVETLFSGSYALGLPPVEVCVVALSLALHLAERLARNRAGGITEWVETTRLGALTEGAALGTVAALTLALSGSGAEFIYFQF